MLKNYNQNFQNSLLDSLYCPINLFFAKLGNFVETKEISLKATIID